MEGAQGRRIIAAGFAAVAVLILAYSRYQDSEYITPDAVDDFLRLAVGFYVALPIALGGVSYGLYLYHKAKISDESSLLGVIARATWSAKSRRIFVVTFLVYGAFFSMASGGLVYQPDVTFSYHYGVDIPSAELVPCCDAPGYMPKILVYLSEHVGLQLVPINMILQLTVSYLVGLNVAIAASIASKKRKGMTGVGAITGLFVACPTCVGTASSLFVGTAGGIVLSAALVQLQTLFIAIAIPILFVTPFLLAKKLRDSENCRMDPGHD